MAFPSYFCVLLLYVLVVFEQVVVAMFIHQTHTMLTLDIILFPVAVYCVVYRMENNNFSCCLFSKIPFYHSSTQCFYIHTHSPTSSFNIIRSLYFWISQCMSFYIFGCSQFLCALHRRRHCRRLCGRLPFFPPS